MRITRHDPFGVEREHKINSSGIRNIFTPHTPVNSVELFLGRTQEVKQIIAQINTPGQHSLLFGDRGVGKSSLANITSELIFGARVVHGKLYRCRCDSSSTFERMIAPVLSEAGIDLEIAEVTEEHQQGGGASIGISAGLTASAKLKSDRKVVKKRIRGQIAPSTAADWLSEYKGLLVIDELDAVKANAERWKLAEFIKQLSDRRSPLKILAVGIGQTAQELTQGHKSVERCLKETKVQTLHDQELKEIILVGAKKAKIVFEMDVVERIVKLSSGYPHFTHLLALKCAEEVIAEGLSSISAKLLQSALTNAANEAEGTLRNTFDASTRSSSTDQYRDILCAAALIPEPEFTAERLRAAYRQHTGIEITQGALNNYFKRLVSDNNDTVLIRRMKGVYGFADPRMPCFIRIKYALL